MLYQPSQIPHSYISDGTKIFVAGLVATVFLKLAASVVNNLLLSPLRDIPGPLPARLSSLWISVIDFLGFRAAYMMKLHERYGDTVRFAPNGVSYTSAAAARDIYLGVDVDIDLADDGASRESFWKIKRNTTTTTTTTTATVTKTFPKSPRYDSFGKRGLFRMRDEEEHRQRMRRVGHSFSSSLMPDMEGVMREEITNLLRAMDAYRGSQVNMLYWARMLALDVSGQLFLGSSFDALKSDSPPTYVKDLDNAYPSWFIHRNLRPLHVVLSLLPIQSANDLAIAGWRAYDIAAKCFVDYIARYGRSSNRRLPLTRLIAGNSDQGIAPLSDDAIVAEIGSMLFAGTDTTGNTLTYAFFELARNPAWHARLRDELASLSATTAHDNEKNNSDEDHVVFPHDALQNLPVLNAIIWETLRLYPAVPQALPRVVPKGGAPIAGRFMPAGTEVGVLTCGLQRTAAVFPNPGEWDPERWLTPPPPPSPTTTTTHAHANENGVSTAPGAVDAAASAGAATSSLSSSSSSSARSDYKFDSSGNAAGNDAMRAHMLVFSRGPRICLGRAIALMELRLAVSAMAARFASIRLASAQTLDDMQMHDHFVLTPKGRKCMLIFE